MKNPKGQHGYLKIVKQSLRNSRADSIGSILHQQKIENDNMNKRESKALKQQMNDKIQASASSKHHVEALKHTQN